MTASACNCPVLPAFDELTSDELTALMHGGPLRCVSCGEVLELRCPEGHIHRAPPVVRGGGSPVYRRGKETRPRVFRPKPCTKCGAEFTPTGARDGICRDCRAKVEP